MPEPTPPGDDVIQARTGPLHPRRYVDWRGRLGIMILGAIGFAIAGGVWHLFEDHLTHHADHAVQQEIVNLINTGRIQVAPPPGPPPPSLPAATVEKGK